MPITTDTRLRLRSCLVSRKVKTLCTPQHHKAVYSDREQCMWDLQTLKAFDGIHRNSLWKFLITSINIKRTQRHHRWRLNGSKKNRQHIRLSMGESLGHIFNSGESGLFGRPCAVFSHTPTHSGQNQHTVTLRKQGEATNQSAARRQGQCHYMLTCLLLLRKGYPAILS